MQLRHSSGGTLRPSAALRRKRGLAGDVRYVFTVLFGVRASKRELAELEHRQGLRQTSRRRHLITLGRTAVITDSFDHPALGKGREQLQAIEDERSKHAGAVAASDAELERVRRDRDTKAKQYVADLSATDAELAELAKKLEPLEKEAATTRKRAQELRESLQRIEKKIADSESLLNSVRAEKLDKAGIEADIATFKADRHAVLRDEPVIAAELDALDPRIAAMEATRAELKKKRAELEKAEQDDQRRTSELLEAIGAKRKVVERAAADAETARDQALFELGDRLYVDRPHVLTAQLSPIDQIDLELGEGDRRMMELREIISNVDKAKLARGAAMIIVALAAAGSIVTWLVYALL
jgi:chromosome segregation ATPase